MLAAWFKPIATMKGRAIAPMRMMWAAYVATPNELERNAMNW